MDIWAHHCQNTVSVSVKTFFFFFGEHLHLDRKTVQILGMTFFFFFFGEHLNLGRKNRLNFDRETQCIKSFFGQKFAAPPNHFELLRPCATLKYFVKFDYSLALSFQNVAKYEWLGTYSARVMSTRQDIFKKCYILNSEPYNQLKKSSHWRKFRIEIKSSYFKSI